MWKKCGYFGIVLSCSTLFACTTVQNISSKTEQIVTRSKVTPTTKMAHHSTNPDDVLLIKEGKISRPFRPIGEIAVNHYNIVGIKRQTAVLYDLLKQNAAKLGGDAIIHIRDHKNEETGEVIQFLA